MLVLKSYMSAACTWFVAVFLGLLVGRTRSAERLEAAADGVPKWKTANGPKWMSKRADYRIHMNGEPKSGTSWLEIVAHTLAKTACDPRYGNKCEYRKSRVRNFFIFFEDGRLANFQANFGKVSKHNMFPPCAEMMSGQGHPETNSLDAGSVPYIHHPPSTSTKQCVKGSEWKCPCAIVPPRSNLGMHLLKTHRTALATCAARIFERGNACYQSRKAGGASDRYLLIIRDPRDTAISEYFYQKKYQRRPPKRFNGTDIELWLEARLPITATYTSLRYLMAEQYNLQKPVSACPGSCISKFQDGLTQLAEVCASAECAECDVFPGTTDSCVAAASALGAGAGAGDGRGDSAATVDPFLVVHYDALKQSLDPYRKMCRLFGLTDCNDKLLLEVKEAESAGAMRAARKKGKGPAEPKTRKAKLRSAGKKTLGSYNLRSDYLATIAGYIEHVLPAPLVDHLKAGSDDWLTHRLYENVTQKEEESNQ